MWHNRFGFGFAFPFFSQLPFHFNNFFAAERNKRNCNKVWQQLRAANKLTTRLQSTMATMVWQLTKKKKQR